MSLRPDGASDGSGPARPSDPAVVPHVVGHHVDQALRRLDDLGLRARVVTTEVHDKTDRHVVTTHPGSGAVVEEGTTVELVVGIAPVVGDYVGSDLDEAVRLAEHRGHVVEVLPSDGDGGDGSRRTVTAQEPGPGENSRVLILRHPDHRRPPAT